MTNKIKSLAALKAIREQLRRQGKRVVFTNGCFDIVHYGHARYLQDARRRGDVLIVAVNSDASVRRIKGEARPIVKERDRARVIAALESVDFVVIFGEATPLEAITALKPDILVKGADWKKESIVGREIVERGGGRVVTIPLAKGRSTSAIIKRILETSA